MIGLMYDVWKDEWLHGQMERRVAGGYMDGLLVG